MRNLRLDICYDGTRYRGWQRLGDSDNTIQGKLETTLSRILGETVVLLDGGEGTARETRRRLAQAGLLEEGLGELILENSKNDPDMIRRAYELLTERE
jgi:hypothetical protein